MEFSPQKESEIWSRVMAGTASAEPTEQTNAQPSAAVRESNEPTTLTPGIVMALIEEELVSACEYRMLAARSCGGAQQTLLKHAADEQQHARRLCAIYFLMTGSKAQPTKPTAPCITCRAAALRDRYREEQEDVAAYEKLAAVGGEFSQTFYEIAADEQRHAQQLVCVIEQTV